MKPALAVFKTTLLFVSSASVALSQGMPNIATRTSSRSLARR